MQMLKLVACTKVYKNVGNNEMPMWRCVDGNEYIVSRFNKEPKWKDVGKAISKFQHILEGALESDIKEIYAGFELYETESLTHGENFQLRNGGTIDFPAKDIEEIDVTEAMDGIKGL
jgi:hypothetical protein